MYQKETQKCTASPASHRGIISLKTKKSFFVTLTPTHSGDELKNHPMGQYYDKNEKRVVLNAFWADILRLHDEKSSQSTSLFFKNKIESPGIIVERLKIRKYP